MKITIKDMVWKKFWRLTVIWEWRIIRYKNQTKRMFIFKCDCWNIVEIVNQDVRRGHTRSCWCYNSELSKSKWIFLAKNYPMWKWKQCPMFWRFLEENPNRKWWRVKLSKLIRNSIEYSLWRNSIFKRDNYTCFVSGKKWIELEVHHKKQLSKIIPWYTKENFRDCVELWDINNWITISKKIHREFHKKYWKENATYKDLLYFKKEYLWI